MLFAGPHFSLPGFHALAKMPSTWLHFNKNSSERNYEVLFIFVWSSASFPPPPHPGKITLHGYGANQICVLWMFCQLVSARTQPLSLKCSPEINLALKRGYSNIISLKTQMLFLFFKDGPTAPGCSVSAALLRNEKKFQSERLMDAWYGTVAWTDRQLCLEVQQGE